jgi:hypothetical protein
MPTIDARAIHCDIPKPSTAMETSKFESFIRVKLANASSAENMFILLYCMAGEQAAKDLSVGLGVDSEKLLSYVQNAKPFALDRALGVEDQKVVSSTLPVTSL